MMVETGDDLGVCQQHSSEDTLCNAEPHLAAQQSVTFRSERLAQGSWFPTPIVKTQQSKNSTFFTSTAISLLHKKRRSGVPTKLLPNAATIFCRSSGNVQKPSPSVQHLFVVVHTLVSVRPGGGKIHTNGSYAIGYELCMLRELQP